MEQHSSTQQSTTMQLQNNTHIYAENTCIIMTSLIHTTDKPVMNHVLQHRPKITHFRQRALLQDILGHCLTWFTDPGVKSVTLNNFQSCRVVLHKQHLHLFVVHFVSWLCRSNQASKQFLLFKTNYR